MDKPLRVLVLCTGNSARSQMAEGLLRDLAAGRVEAYSAGLDPKGLNPLATEAMAELGIDIAGQRSKHLNEYLQQRFDYVITVCGNADEHCPTFPGPATRLHWGYPDPAAVEGAHTARLHAFREVRDALRAQIVGWLPQVLGAATPNADSQ